MRTIRLRFVLKLCIIYFLIFTFLGCDAFVRKFTRKPKKENLPQEELVLVPEEYKPTLSREELYRQYLLYWKSWQDELIEALNRKNNYKKQVSCADQALKNLVQLKQYLNEEKNKKLDVYLAQLKDLRDSIADDDYSIDLPNYRSTAERIRRAVLREFSYNKVKNSLI